MDFGDAIRALKQGKRVARSGWNGNGMFLVYYAADQWRQGNFEYSNFTQLPFIAVKTVEDKMVPWLANQIDMLAQDWGVV